MRGRGVRLESDREGRRAVTLMALRFRTRLLFSAILLPLGVATASDLPSPWVERAAPLGALRGSTIEVELTGRYLSNASSVEFDCDDIEWLETIETRSGSVRGRLRVARDAALGPHIFSVITQDGLVPAQGRSCV